jgi:chaperonin GroES
MAKQNTLIPMGDMLLVTPLEVTNTESKIIIPETAKDKPQLCMVVRLGTGKLTRDAQGKLHTEPFRVKEGDRIIVSKYGGTDIELEGVSYKLLQQSDILALVK